MCKEVAKILAALDNTYSNLSKEGKTGLKMDH